MPEIAPKEKRAKSSLTAFQAFFGKPCCRQTKYNSTGPKTRSKCEGQASAQARASEVRRGASAESPGDRRPPECEGIQPRGIGQLRRPARRSGVCARIHGGRGGAGDSQDERTPAGDPGGRGLRVEALGPGEEVRPGATVIPRGPAGRTVREQFVHPDRAITSRRTCMSWT